MGISDRYADGQWNFYCDLCGKKTKSGSGTKTWDNRWVCRHHKEVRNPQDFIKGVKDDQSLPWSRPRPPDVFHGPACTLEGSNAIPDLAVPGCFYPSNINLSFTATNPLPGPYCTTNGSTANPGFAVPGCSIPSHMGSLEPDYTDGLIS